MREAVPYPPFELANRVGWIAGLDDPFAHYDLIGRESRESIVSLLAPGWTWDGKQVLDFGCGAGRILRHFLPEADVASFQGCDIDTESVEWVNANLSTVRAFVNAEAPPLPVDSGALDLVYVVSVFTHLTDMWSAWLLELHRVLKNNGRLIVTFIGPGAAPSIMGEAWNPDSIGMNILKPGQSWDLGGPMVVHSPWWIEAHWGRAFEIDEIRLDGFDLPSPEGQGVVSMRKRPVRSEPADLEALEDGEPREATAAAYNVRQLIGEVLALRNEHDRLSVSERELRDSVERMANSNSWRLTRPLRWLVKSAVPSRR